MENVFSSSSLSPVSRREPAWKAVYRTLRTAIVNRQFEPDTRLLELELARTLGVSRTPVREALARLEVDGLIVASGRSYVVTDPRADLADGYHFRAALEGYGARLAAERATAQEIARMRRNVEESLTVDIGNTRRRAQLNAEFHQLVAQASRSPRIIRALTAHRDLVMTDEDMTIHTPEALKRFLREHDMIVSAIEMHDADTAEGMMRTHMRHALTLLSEGPLGHAAEVAREDAR